MSIQSVDRALEILQLFSAAKTRLGISQMSKALGIKNSTVHGLVRTLVKQGFLIQNSETRKYSLGVKNYELSHFFLGGLKIYQVGSGTVHRLVQRTGRNSRLAIWDNDTVVVIMDIFAKPENFHYYNIGPRIPAYCTSLGKAILASFSPKSITAYFERNRLVPYTAHTITEQKSLVEDLEQTTLRGYAIDREEAIMGVFCMAAPIFDESKRPVAAISLSGSSDLLDSKKLSKAASDLILASKEISYSMGFQPKVPV